MKVYELGGKAQIKMTGDWLKIIAGYAPGDEIEVELCADGSIRISHADVVSVSFRELPKAT